MAKRLTDSNKWQDAWFMDLPNKYKLLWLYLLDSCDHAGFWKVNFKTASFYIGEHLEPSEVKRILASRLNIISDEYWQITKFIDFQYGGVKNDAVGKSVQKILNHHSIEHSVAPTKPLPSPYEGTKVKDKAKDKVISSKGEFKNDSFSDWIAWGDLIVSDNDAQWHAMRGRKVSRSEMDSFLSVATRNKWVMDSQAAFRLSLKGFKPMGGNNTLDSNGRPKSKTH